MVTGRDRSLGTAGADSGSYIAFSRSLASASPPPTRDPRPLLGRSPSLQSPLTSGLAVSCARDGSTKLMSSAARTPGVIPHSGLVVPNSNKYVSLYVLLAGIIGGLLLILSLFLFCKYCRGKSQGTEGVGVPTGDSWVLREASFSLEQPDDEDSIRDREETTVRRGSWGSERSKLESESSPRAADASRGVLEEVSRNVPSSSRLVDDHVKTNIFLHRQKSFQKNDASSPITCFVKPTTEVVECEVAVEVHPGPSVKTSTTKPGPPPLLRHASVTSLCSNKGWECTEEGETEQQGSWRASSTDWTKLETSLDYWRQEHFKAQREDLTNSSKVRYNDTGSLEEVSVDNCVDYFVEDEIMVHLEAEREHMRQQYRRLWQLRATLEEDEKPNVKQPSQGAAAQPASPAAAPAPIPAPAAAPTPAPAPGPTAAAAPSSPDQSPEAEVPGSHTTSFDSNTEPLLEEGSTRLPPHLLQLPSYETRRQNYRNILNWRLRKMEARNARRHCGRQTSLEDTSFDSMDTVDTEESSTDASRIDQATTSFESTTDNTDSPSEQQAHRLQQLRADSGYRSLENPAPNTLKLLYPQQHVTSSEDPHALGHRIPSLGESFENVSEAEEGISVIDIDIEGCSSQRTSEDLDEGVAGLRSPPLSIYESSPWEGRRKPGGQPTSKKRRDLSGSTPAVRAEYARDYSVDEKSDALFREFSRCDLDSKRQHRLTAYRRLRGPYPYPKLSEPPSDELALASVPIIRVAPEDESSDRV